MKRELTSALFVLLAIFLVATACTPAAPTPTATVAAATKAPETSKPAAPAATASPASKAAEKPAAGQQPLEKIAMVQMYSAGALSPYWLTKDEGIFKKYGLDVETVMVNGVELAVAALNSGQAEGIPTAPQSGTLAAAAQDMDISLVMAFSNQLNYVVIARPEVKGVQDMKGKKLAINRIGDSDYFLIRDALTRLGLKPDDVQYIPVGNMPDRLTALVQGMVDVTTLTPPMDLTAKKQGMVQLANLAELGIPYVATGLHVRRSSIKNKPQLVENMVKALIEGMYVFRTNKEIGMKTIRNNMKVEDPEVLDYTWQVIANGLIKQAPYPSEEGMKAVIADSVSENSAIQGLPPEKVIDNSVLKKIEASGFIESLTKGQ